MKFEEILEIDPYSLNHTAKKKMLTKRLVELTELHKNSCPEYAKMLDGVFWGMKDIESCEELPFIPVRLFKELELKSVDSASIVKTMTSSGTTGQKVSKIYLDRATSSNQQKAMVRIVSDFTGSGRMPMIIIDCPSVVKDRKKFSARGAGILGFSIFGAKKMYALDDDMNLDVEGLRNFLDTYKGQKMLLFGFTFMVWQYFYQELCRLKDKGITFDLSNCVMIHGGGWKKLQSEAVSHEEFHNRIKDICGLDRIYDYYGMVEQTGCIYMQCEYGHLHASVFSDVIARRPKDFSVCKIGEKGILQVVSSIPESYPGHSLLTEDEGVILGEDDCPCGRKGKYFQINGRIAKAEIRGCSDTYAADHAVVSLDDGITKSNVLDTVSVLVGNKIDIENIRDVSPKQPFDAEVINFLNTLSKKLMTGHTSRIYPDIVTLGFWLRKSSMMSLKKRFLSNDKLKIGRGVAFHIAPSNVPVNYAYSLFAGLICGNANIVRVPSKEFPQVDIINNAINSVLDDNEFFSLKPYINIVKYGRNKEINDYFSSICDVRIIWGGDNTIAELRNSKLAPKATDIVFADRYSLAVVDSDKYLALADKTSIASGFYNDTYLSDQNACTSPRVVVWTGKNIEKAKTIFWKELESIAERKYIFQPIQGIDKLSQFYLAVANCSGLKKECNNTNLLYRIKVNSLTTNLMNYRGNSGYFYEYDCEDIFELRDFCNDTHCQTVGYIGDKEFIQPLLKSGLKGIDRVVPVGHTMDFDLNWDGYDLVSYLTRTIAI